MSRNQLNLAHPPALVEERLKRAVEPKDHKPALLRIGLDPVAAGNSFGLCWAEIDDGRTIHLRLRCRRWKALAARTRIFLRRVEHRAGHVVVNGE